MKSLKHEPVSTMLTINVGFLIIYMFTQWEWIFYAAVIIGLIGILSPYLSRKIDFLWMKLAKILSFIVPNILLSVVYFLILTPFAFLSRILGPKNPLNLRNPKGSLFVDSNKSFARSSFEKPW